MITSPIYRFPQIYINGLKLYHGRNFARRYRYIAGFVKKNDTVLEPGCGPAILADFMKNKSHYSGFDTNPIFVKFCFKKGLRVKLGNVLEKSAYHPATMVAVCDVLHHLPPNTRKKFIQNCFQATRKIFVICDPGKPEIKKTGFWKKLGEWSEQDGTNNFQNHYFLTKKQLLGQIKNGFDCIPDKIKRTVSFFGEDIVAVFYKDEKK